MIKSRQLSAGLLFVVLVPLLCLTSTFRNIDHDEGQYVAAVALMRIGLPYRDFAYLQTPLQPLLFAPLAWICEGWLFPALRATNAVCAAGAAALLFSAVRRAGGSHRSACIAALGLATCHSFLFAATVARNDALPLLLHMAGLWFLIVALNSTAEARPRLMLAAGLALGAAASAKISFALPAAAVGLVAVLHLHRLGNASVAALAVGGITGFLPTVVLWWIAPDAAWFGIIDYSLAAPFEWRSLNGQSYMLAWPLSLVRMLRFLAEGLGLLALILLVRAHVRKTASSDDSAQAILLRMLDMMILAGLVAAWLPRPIYVQYLGPLLPALLVRLGLMLDGDTLPRWASRFALPAFMLLGVSQTAIGTMRNLINAQSPVVSLMRDARAIRAAVSNSGAPSAIVTLAPERVVDSAIALDRAFVTGPFLFRTQFLLKGQQQDALHTTTMQTASAYLSRHRPAAILLGVETEPTTVAPRGLEQPLVDWATINRYRALRLPSGRRLLVAQ